MFNVLVHRRFCVLSLGIFCFFLNPFNAALAEETSAKNPKLEVIEKLKIESYSGPSASGSGTYYDCNTAVPKDVFAILYNTAATVYPQVLPEPSGDLYCTVNIGYLDFLGKHLKVNSISFYPKKEVMMQCVTENKCGGDSVMIILSPDGSYKMTAFKGDLLDNIVCMSSEGKLTVKNRKENCEP